MLLDQLNQTYARISHILKVLREQHQFEFPLKQPHEWQTLWEHYSHVQHEIKHAHDFNSYHTDPAYARAVLITEAVRMLLEIRPRRMRKNKVTEHTQSEVITMNKLNEKAHKAKPDFLDVDGDGDTKESFKKAIRDKHAASGGATSKRKKVTETYGAHTFEITFVDDHSDDPQTTTVKANDVNQARRRFLADNPDSYIEKINKVMRESRTLREDANLDQAETLLAAKDMSDRLQDMAEDAAKMAVDKLMPLVDTMKQQFGQPAADGFNSVVKGQLQAVLDAIIAAKDATDNAIMSLQSGETPTDASTPDIAADLPAPEPDAGAPVDATDGDAAPDIDFDKEFSATPSASGPESEPLGRTRKQDVAEARKRNPYAIGMAQAKKELGFTKRSAKDLPKKVITRAHEIARSIEQDVQEQTLSEAKVHLKQLVENYKQLRTQLQEHEQAFRASGAPDPLQLGRGWQGDVILNQIMQLTHQIKEARAHRDQVKATLQEQAHVRQVTASRAQSLQEQMQVTPYGVVGRSTSGQRVKQFFEHATARDMWVDYNKHQLSTWELVNPDRIQQVQHRLANNIKK